MVRQSVSRKYKKIASEEANSKKIYFNKEDCSKQLLKLKKDIYNSYSAMIEDEISSRLLRITKSDKFSRAVNAERELSKKTLHYKAIKKYQRLPIHISDSFIDELYHEVNKDVIDADLIKREELRYLTLLIFYGIIDSIKQGLIVKFGTVCRLWCNKRDFVSNLPIDNRIKYDRMFPKLKLCSSFDTSLFRIINKDNESIINYYKAKAERLLILLKVKNAKG